MSSPLLCSRRGFGLVSAALVCEGLLSPGRAQPPEPVSPTLRAIRERRRLRVGMHPGFAPFVVAGPEVAPFLGIVTPMTPRTFTSADGRLVAGLDVDLAAATAQSLGAELHISLVDRLEALFPLLCRGEVDMVLSGITRTLSRAAYLSFSNPYLISGQEVFTADTRRFPTLKSVASPGVRVGAERGTTAEAFAHRSLVPARLASFGSSAELLAALSAGSLDAVVIDSLLGRDAVLRKRVPGTLHSVENRRVTSDPIALAARQGDPDWTAFLNLVLRELRISGAFSQMAHCYNPWLRAQR